MFNVHSDHAFFYQPAEGKAVAQMNVVEPKHTQPVRLAQHPSDATRFRRQRFDEMQPYSAEALDAAIEARVSTTFYAYKLDEVEADLRARQLLARPQYKDHRTVRAYAMKLGDPGRKKRAEGQSQNAAIRINRVTDNVHRLHLLAAEFQKHTGLSLPYHGEELPTLMRRLIDEHLYWRRSKIPREIREIVRVRQDDKCEKCGDALAGHGELHHIKAVADGGSNDSSNLQLLCHMCHTQISESQHLAKNPRLSSCFNPEMMNLFNNAALKPKQIHWGIGVSGDDPLKTVWSIDINGCRRNALLHAEYLPSFEFTDDLESYDVNRFDEYDFFWVDNGVELNLERCECDRATCSLCLGTSLNPNRLRSLPYDGPKLYPKVAVKYFLELGICRHDSIYWAVKASRRIKTSDLNATLQLAERLLTKVFPDDEGVIKRAMLSLIGLWGRPYTVEWHVERTRIMEDMDRVTMVGVDAEGVPPTHKAHTVVLSNYSYMPIALHVLNQEAVWMNKIFIVICGEDEGVQRGDDLSTAASSTISSWRRSRGSAASVSPTSRGESTESTRTRSRSLV
jgi:hypothetical protein